MTAPREPYDPVTSEPQHKRTTVWSRTTLWSSGVAIFLFTIVVLWLYGWVALMLMVATIIATALFGAAA